MALKSLVVRGQMPKPEMRGETESTGTSASQIEVTLKCKTLITFCDPVPLNHHTVPASTPGEGFKMGAIISECGLYRYRLEREVLPEGQVGMFCWVNPSTATAEVDDASSRKGIGFATRLEWCRYILVNPFAFRAKDVNDLRSAADPIGPDNDRHIEQAMRDADVHVVGWGSLAKLPEALRGRWKDIVRIADRVGCELHCIGVCSDGHPRHPLMTSYDVPVTRWNVPWFACRATNSPARSPVE